MFVVTGTAISFSQPMVPIPEQLTKSQLEVYEDSQELFTLKLLDLYNTSVIYHTQLSLIGDDPDQVIEDKLAAQRITKLSPPTNDEVRDQDYRTLQKYQYIAKVLGERIISLGQSSRPTWEDNVKRVKYLDSLYDTNLTLLQQQYMNDCRDMTTIVSVAATGNVFISNGGDNVRNDPGLGVKGTVNINRLFGFWPSVDFWYEYQAPNFYTQYDMGEFEFKDKWNADIHAVGLGVKLPVGVSDKLVHGLNLSAGYFWSEGYAINRPYGSFVWEGFNANIEYFFGVPSCRFPFELYFDFSLYSSFNKNLVFLTNVPRYDNLDIGNTHLAFSVGIRYNFLRSAF
ncbi:MAG: hypothetical protein CVV22_06575 [Ignavibacteriae bacterium HGW-Ignavibacteriae-1]|jgi:hypothetical protein|nr:MAG: hypothetical protein CVV22_06575 [Ignavibacteriae bacterium HGW-Ignavibacteriae-1]